VIVAKEARGHLRPAAARWRTGCGKRDVRDVLEKSFLSVIIAPLINDLAQELDRWLGTVPYHALQEEVKGGGRNRRSKLLNELWKPTPGMLRSSTNLTMRFACRGSQ